MLREGDALQRDFKRGRARRQALDVYRLIDLLARHDGAEEVFSRSVSQSREVDRSVFPLNRVSEARG